MNSVNKSVLILLVILAVQFSAADDSQAIRDLCRLRVGIFPHPNSKLCNEFVKCQVSFSTKLKNQVIKGLRAIFHFQQLINGVVDRCQTGYIFDEKEKRCVVGNKLTCEKDLLSKPEKTNSAENGENIFQLPDSSLPILPPLNLEELCHGNALGFLPNPNACTTFIVCVFEIGEVNSCPSSIPIFDPVRLICVQGIKFKSIVFVS